MQSLKAVSALNAIPTPEKYEEWVRISMAYHAEGGDFESWNSWCKQGGGYDYEKNLNIWKKLKPDGGITGATLYAEARKYGWKDPDQKDSSETPGVSPCASGFKGIKPDTEEMRQYIKECAEAETEAKKYFCDERGFLPGTVSRYRLGIDCNDDAAVIPYPNEDYCVRRFLSISPDGKGQKYDNPAGDKRVFNANAMKQSARPVFVLEGQIDALSIMEAGGIACTGQNEKNIFIELARKADAPGFIIVPDNDNNDAGEKSAAKLEETLKREGIDCIKVSLPPEIHDANEFLRKRGREALQKWITEKERSIMPRKAITLRELQKKIEAEGEADPNELIRNRFICKGGAGILAAETGTGKSSIMLQLVLYWSAGIPCFGFSPTRPLKILVIQAENDERDICDDFNGICRGSLDHGDLTQDQIDTALETVKIISDASHSGTSFIREVKNLLSQNPETDLVVIDPLFSFAGCDLSNQGDVSKFFRNEFQPLLNEKHIAAIFIHHAPKSSRNAPQNANFNTAYSYYGSAEIVNWSRFCIYLERKEDAEQNTFFKLTVAKRGNQLGWGAKAKYLRWSEGYIYWQELPEQPETPQITNSKEDAKKKAQERLRKEANQATELLQPGESVPVTVFRNRIKEQMGIHSHERIESIMSCAVKSGKLLKRDAEKDEKTYSSSRTMIERPQNNIDSF